jgi:hypothetical protein
MNLEDFLKAHQYTIAALGVLGTFSAVALGARSRRPGQPLDVASHEGRPLANPQIFCRLFAPVLDNVECDLRALGQRAEARFFDRRDMDEDVLAAAIGLNEPVPLSRVEPLHCTSRHVLTPPLKAATTLERFLGVRQGKSRRADPAASSTSPSGERYIYLEHPSLPSLVS